MILNRKGRKTLSQFLLQYITNNKGLLGVDGYSNVKYLTERKEQNIILINLQKKIKQKT